MRRRRWQSETGRAWARLALCAAGVTLLWLGLLPMVGRQPAIRSYIDRNEELGIDPSAKFYTEVPAAPELYDRVATAQRRNRSAFW